MWGEVDNVYSDELFPYNESYFQGLKITANMGKNYAPSIDSGIHLDSILSYAVMLSINPPPLDKEKPRIFPIPIKIITLYDKLPLLAVTPLMPCEEIYSSEYWHKRFPIAPVQRLCLAPNTVVKSGQYKNYRVPMRVVSCEKLECYCIGDKDAISKLLAKINFIGKKISQGKGLILSWNIEACSGIDEDFILKNRTSPLKEVGKISCGLSGWTSPYWFRPWHRYLFI